MTFVSLRALLALVRGGTHPRPEGNDMEQRYSKCRVERDNRLLYIEGDPIDPEDIETLQEQGFLDEKPKAKKKTADKARKAKADK